MRKTILAVAAALLACFMLAAPASAGQPVNSCALGINPLGGNTEGCLIQPQASSAAEASHVFKASGPATLVDFSVANTSGSAIWVFVFDAATAPGNGTVTGCVNAGSTRPCVAKWYQIAANASMNVTWNPGPFPQLQTGAVIECSSTGPFTLTAATTTCAMSAEVM